MADGDRPVGADGLCARFGELSGAGALALAVSGGSDSMALMQVAALWRAACANGRPAVTVLSVDHGLRQASAEEASTVRQEAERLGLQHRTLVWKGAAPKSGLAARAREARYRLMTDWCTANEVERLFLGHTRDDQAETVLMRLARGSGVDGLAGMAPLSWRHGVALARPFLDVSRSQLRAFLARRGLSWIDDPTNEDGAFERVRIRNALDQLGSVGVQARQLATTARRMQRAKSALNCMVTSATRRHVEVYHSGCCKVSAGLLPDEPEEVVLRVLARCLTAVGGAAKAPRQASLERLCQRLRHGDFHACTLGGCEIACMGKDLRVTREPGRIPRRPVRLRRGETVVWDGRFHVGYDSALADPGPDAAIIVRSLRDEGWDFVKQSCDCAPKSLRQGLVSFWRNGAPVAVPHLRYRHPELRSDIAFTAEFCNFHLLEGARVADRAGGS